MAIAFLGPHVKAISGSIGGITYVPLGDQQVLRHKAQRFKRSAGQNAQPKRVRAAARYWRSVVLNPELKAFYDSLPRQTCVGAYQHAVRDFMNPPVVEGIDLSRYSGRRGDSILIKAVDETGVLSVAVRIEDMEGQVLEQGAAKLEQDRWIYTASAQVASGRTVCVKATAKDRPGNAASESRLVYLK